MSTTTHANASAVRAVGRHASPGVGSVNTWWIETDTAIVVIDAQRQASQARQAAAAIQAIGKPVAVILLTHPHPDHVGGLAALHAAFPDAPIMATAATAEVMRTDAGGLFALTHSYLGDDFGVAVPAVTAVLPDIGTLAIGDLVLDHTELGLGETVAACVFLVHGTEMAFVGDVVANAMTPWLMEGHTGAWLEQLDHAARLLPATVLAYPGHGASAPWGELVAAQTNYLRQFRQGVIAAAQNGVLNAAAIAAVVAATEHATPGWLPVAGVPDLIARNAEAVGRELGLTVAV